MNYYDARQLEDGSGWHYTRLNRRLGTWPIGYCVEHGGHATASEARECFRRYLLDGAELQESPGWTGCVVCDAPTKKGLTTRRPLGRGYPLCDEHRTREQLEDLVGLPGQITATD